MDTFSDFGDHLRKLAVRTRGKSFNGMADAVGVHRSVLSRRIKARTISMRQADACVSYLGIEVHIDVDARRTLDTADHMSPARERQLLRQIADLESENRRLRG